MKYVPLVGIGMAIWGLITLDWFKFGFGVVLFFGAFLFDFSKKKGAMKDDKVFPIYRTVSELTRIIRKSIEGTEAEKSPEKAKLAQGLFFLGMLDAASQAASLDDRQFLDLFKATFADLDYDFDQSYQTKLLLFHQSQNTKHGAFPAIMKGGELFTKFANGNTMAPIAGGMSIEELVQNPSFPASVEYL